MLRRLKKKKRCASATWFEKNKGTDGAFVEQVDQADPLPHRSNGWRYLPPRGVTYRCHKAVFGAAGHSFSMRQKIFLSRAVIYHSESRYLSFHVE